MPQIGPCEPMLKLSFNKLNSYLHKIKSRSSRPEVFCKKGVLRNFATFTRKHLCQVSFLIKLQSSARILFLIKLQASACNFIKKETLALVFSCEFCEIFKNTFFYRTHPVVASVSRFFLQNNED